MKRRKIASSAASREAIERHEERGRRFEFLKKRLAKFVLEEVWEELEENLRLGDGRRSHERVSRALDDVDDNVRKAGMVAQVAIEESDEFEIHYRAAYAEWERRARQTLERAKREKRHSGMITNDQVENWVARNVPDYRRWRDARRALDRNKTLTKQMSDAWTSRAASLRKQTDLFMSRRPVDPNMIPRRGRGEGAAEDGQEE